MVPGAGFPAFLRSPRRYRQTRAVEKARDAGRHVLQRGLDRGAAGAPGRDHDEPAVPIRAKLQVSAPGRTRAEFELDDLATVDDAAAAAHPSQRPKAMPRTRPASREKPSIAPAASRRNSNAP